MKKLIYILSVLVSLHSDISGAQIMRAIPQNPPEAWLALTCRGVVTPLYNYPIQFKDVVKFYIQVDPSKPRPSLKQMSTQSQYMPKFEQMAKYCTDQRLKIVQTNVEPGQTFLDWGTESGYSRFVQGEVFIPAGTACRAVGQPCGRVSQCCGYANPIATRTTCDLNTNSCVKMVKVAGPIKDAGVGTN